jgi:hypothetical protein
VTIDFNQRFDLHTQLRNEAVVFKGCRIVGFVEGDDSDGGSGWNPSAKLFATFSRGWLVIEQSDGRRAYVPAGSIVYFEDAAK